MEIILRHHVKMRQIESENCSW